MAQRALPPPPRGQPVLRGLELRWHRLLALRPLGLGARLRQPAEKAATHRAAAAKAPGAGRHPPCGSAACARASAPTAHGLPRAGSSRPGPRRSDHPRPRSRPARSCAPHRARYPARSPVPPRKGLLDQRPERATARRRFVSKLGVRLTPVPRQARPFLRGPGLPHGAPPRLAVRQRVPAPLRAPGPAHGPQPLCAAARLRASALFQRECRRASCAQPSVAPGGRQACPVPEGGSAAPAARTSPSDPPRSAGPIAAALKRVTHRQTPPTRPGWAAARAAPQGAWAKIPAPRRGGLQARPLERLQGRRPGPALVTPGGPAGCRRSKVSNSRPSSAPNRKAGGPVHDVQATHRVNPARWPA